MESERNEGAEARAEAAAQSIRNYFGLKEGEVPAEIAAIFTTGLGKYVDWREDNPKVLDFASIRGFEALAGLGQVEGHARQISLNTIRGENTTEEEKIWRVDGRIHLNENPTDSGSVNAMVRLQIDMLCKLGVKTIILTSAVGSTISVVRIGQIGIVEYCLSDGNSSTGFSGEFAGPEDALCPNLRRIALEANKPGSFEAVPVTHSFWRGPGLEGYKQKLNMARDDAHVVGMSGQPEAEAAARHGVKVLFLAYVTNEYEHDHDQVIEAADEYGPAWMAHLTRVIARIIEGSEPKVLRSINHYFEWMAAAELLGLGLEGKVMEVPDRLGPTEFDSTPFDKVLADLISYLQGVRENNISADYQWLRDFPFIAKKTLLEAIGRIRDEEDFISEKEERCLLSILPGEEDKAEKAPLISSEFWDKILKNLEEELIERRKLDEMLNH